MLLKELSQRKCQFAVCFCSKHIILYFLCICNRVPWNRKLFFQENNWSTCCEEGMRHKQSCCLSKCNSISEILTFCGGFLFPSNKHLSMSLEQCMPGCCVYSPSSWPIASPVPLLYHLVSLLLSCAYHRRKRRGLN